jgi:type VI secretion system secreted protein Hcp
VTNMDNESSKSMDPAPGLLANRRDILRTATGLAAAAVVGGALVDRNQAAMAASVSSSIICQLGDLAPFEVLSFSWGITNTSSTGSGGGGAGTGKAEFQALHLTKYVDVVSPALLVSLAKGEHFDKAMLILGDKKGSAVLRLEMKIVFLASSAISGSSGSEPTEDVELVFGSIKMSYKDASGSWNRMTNAEE